MVRGRQGCRNGALPETSRAIFPMFKRLASYRVNSAFW
jgi:hypothetical protein